MADLPLDLDHVGIAVRDLDAAAGTFEKLGFRLTPRSQHSGARTPGGPVESWGSANHCAMLAHGYIEVLGVTRPEFPSTAAGLLERYEGSHIVALGIDNADAAHEVLRTRDPDIPAPRQLERDAEIMGRTEHVGFRNIYPDPEKYPEARFIIIEHLSREALWHTALLDHPNGALDLHEIWICVDDMNASVERLSGLLGNPAEAQGRHIRNMELRNGRIVLTDTAGLKELTGRRMAPPVTPYVAGFGVRVRNLRETAVILSANGVPFEERPDGALWVDPAHTHGTIVTFLPNTHDHDPSRPNRRSA